MNKWSLLLLLALLGPPEPASASTAASVTGRLTLSISTKAAKVVTVKQSNSWTIPTTVNDDK